MVWRIFLGVMVVFLAGAGAAMLWTSMGVPLHQPLPACPFLEKKLPPGSSVERSIAAYEAMRVALDRGSLEGVAAQARAMAEEFADTDPKVAGMALRLAAAGDVESARRAFLRLNRLLQKHAERWPAA